MSSILEALKKLETESPDAPGAGLWRWSTESTTAACPRIRNICRINPNALILAGIAIALIVIAVFGLIWFQRPQPQPVTSSGPISPIPARKEVISSNQTIQDSAPLTQNSSSYSPRPDVPHSKIVPPAARAAPPTIALETPPPLPQKTAKKPSYSEPVRSPLADEMQTDKTPAPKANNLPPAPTEISAKPYHGDLPIKVQAIAWSDNPAQRLAVINDTVVREGQFIGDISVVTIQPEKIIIQKGGEMWELLFLHQ